MGEISNITVDDIAVLKAQGKWEEAKALLKAFRECGKKNIAEGLKINLALKSKERRIKYKVLHKCLRCGTLDVGEYRWFFCDACYKKHKENTMTWQQSPEGKYYREQRKERLKNEI